MPIRERVCRGCNAKYEVLILGSAARAVGMRGAVGDGDIGDIRCAACGSAEAEEVYNTRVHPVGLGGEAGVGKFYPYHDRALGPGQGLLVKSKQHRDWLMTHQPNGQLRDERLIPLETKTDSGLRGTWEDIADHEAAENEKIDREYNAMVEQIQYEQPAAMAALAQLTPTPTGGTDAA